MKKCTDLFDYNSKKKVFVENCTCCDSNNYFTVFDKDRYGYSVKSNLCLSCGVVFLSPRMDLDSYMEFYNEAYRDLVSCFNERKIDRFTIQEEQVAYAHSVFDFIYPHVVKRISELKILDVGGSTGVVSKVLSDEFAATKEVSFVEATVIDPSLDELEIAKEIGLIGKHGFIEDLVGVEKKYNLIILCQTIDHLFDIQKSLRIMFDALTEDGMFFVDIVDFKYMLKDRGVEKSIKIDHPHNFSFKSVYNLLQNVGFSIRATSVLYDGHLIGFLCTKDKGRVPNYSLENEVDELLNLIRYT